MCGIIGYVGSQEPKGVLLDGLKRLEYRGYDSAGIAVLENGQVEVYRSEGRLHQLEEKLGAKKFRGHLGIGHTRWATHGAPTEMNAHPHRVGSITLVHNGIIENYLEHKENIQKLGREIQSDTDSEILAHLFDLEVSSGKTLADSLKFVLPRLRGSYAFVLMNDHEPDVIVGVRNGAPLLAGIGKGETFLASDVQAILHRTKRIVYLKDHESAICTRDGIVVKNDKGEKVSFEVKTIDWTAEQMEKLGYRHYMLKEIHEQPVALTNTLENNIHSSSGAVSLRDVSQARELLKTIKRISIVACGTARHAGLVGKFYFERFAKIPTEVDFGSEFRYRDPILEEGTLVVAISQSGETADTLAGIREANAKKARTLSICNVRDSSIARESNLVLYTNAGPEIGVASTKAFTTQLEMLYCLAVQLGHLRGVLSDAQAVEFTQDILQLPTLVEKTLQLETEIQKIVEEHLSNTFFFYMGRSVCYPIALEAALKLKEISYLHAEGYAAGELKHGPIALIDRCAAIIVLSPKDRPSRLAENAAWNAMSQTLYEKSMSNLQQVKSRGGQIWCIGSEGEEAGPLAKESKFFSALPRTTWALNPILATIPVQLFAYHMALQKGTDVDKPRNLAKSVTVE